MTDVHTKVQRAYNMSRIQGKNTKPEIFVRKFLFSKGFRYRLHDKRLPGKPDIVLPKYKTVIFVNGCFWHGHANCKYFKLPKTRRAWWKAKIDRNRSNEAKNFNFLKKAGWRVIRIWTCDLKDRQDKTLNSLIRKFY